MEKHFTKSPNPQSNNELQKARTRAIFLQKSFCHRNFATRKLLRRQLPTIILYVLLMTIVVPNRLVQIESNELDFEPQNTDKTLCLTQFNKWGGNLKKCL